MGNREGEMNVKDSVIHRENDTMGVTLIPVLNFTCFN